MKRFSSFHAQSPANTILTNGYDKDYDLVVVRSGWSGLTAAVVAAAKGLRVLVVEKTGFYGGTTAYSGRAAWIPCNKHQKALGVQDSRSETERYLDHVAPNANVDRMKAFFDSGPEMVEYIEKHTMVKFQGVPLPDYHTEKPGASSGRSIVTVAFSGRHLKRQIRKIRYTLKGFSALGSMQANLADLSKLTAPFSSVSNFLFGARKALRFGMDLLKYGKGAEMAHGNALVGRLVSSVQNRGVEFWRNGPAIAPILKDGVDGLVVSSAGQDIRMKARRGVILASGSIGRSPSGQKPVPHEWSAVPKNIQGDGISLAVQAETHTPPPNQGNAIFALISLLRRPDGTTWRYPHFSLDRAKPGSLVVGPNGKRFVNESAPYHEFVKPMRGVSTEPLSFATKTFCENMAWV